MFLPPSAPILPASPAGRLVSILDGLCAAIAARGAGGLLTTPLLFLLWGRLRRLAVRVTRIAARITAGIAPVPRHRPARPRPARPPALRLPRGYAWLVPLVPGAAAYGAQLQSLLADPQAAPLLAAPALRRMLNPLCQMLGVPRPPQCASAPAQGGAGGAAQVVATVAVADRPISATPVVAQTAGEAASQTAPVPPAAPAAA